MEVISRNENDNVDHDSIFGDSISAADDLNSPAAAAKNSARLGTPDSQPSIDFSAATPESKKGGKDDDNNQKLFDDLIGGHDSFDFNDGLDLFSEGGHDDDKSISDISSDGKPKRKQKQKKVKTYKERKVPQRAQEEPEIRKISVVESEMEVTTIRSSAHL